MKKIFKYHKNKIYGSSHPKVVFKLKGYFIETEEVDDRSLKPGDKIIQDMSGFLNRKTWEPVDECNILTVSEFYEAHGIQRIDYKYCSGKLASSGPVGKTVDKIIHSNHPSLIVTTKQS